jgi:hypothetical protein
MFANQSSSLFTPAIVLFCLSIFLGEPWLGEFRSHEWLAGEVARGKGRILPEAKAIPDSRFFTLWPLA